MGTYRELTIYYIRHSKYQVKHKIILKFPIFFHSFLTSFFPRIIRLTFLSFAKLWLLFFVLKIFESRLDLACVKGWQCDTKLFHSFLTQRRNLVTNFFSNFYKFFLVISRTELRQKKTTMCHESHQKYRKKIFFAFSINFLKHKINKTGL